VFSKKMQSLNEVNEWIEEIDATIVSFPSKVLSQLIASYVIECCFEFDTVEFGPTSDEDLLIIQDREIRTREYSHEWQFVSSSLPIHQLENKFQFAVLTHAGANSGCSTIIGLATKQDNGQINFVSNSGLYVRLYHTFSIDHFICEFTLNRQVSIRHSNSGDVKIINIPNSYYPLYLFFGVGYYPQSVVILVPS
jgi:hypothetical protein